MGNLFASYEIAKHLKEKGFIEECLTYYWDDGMMYKGTDSFFNHNKHDTISAPLYQQVVDWFEEKHQIYIGKTGYDDRITPKRFVYHVNKQYCQEQSYEGAIKEALELI